MNDKPPSLWSLVLIPALLTLVVTVLRLVGQLNGWNSTVFGTPAAGGSGAILGISWLIFLFGLWFGFKLRRTTGEPTSLGKAFGLALLAPVITGAGIAACRFAGLITMPDAEHPGEPSGTPFVLGCVAVGLIVSLVAWRRVAVALLVYGVLARVPVIAVTWLAIDRGWDTHYTKLAPGFVVKEDALFGMLAFPQVVFWIPGTVMLGTLMACIGAAVAGRPTRTS
jgi:hypothetical protein